MIATRGKLREKYFRELEFLCQSRNLIPLEQYALFSTFNSDVI